MEYKHYINKMIFTVRRDKGITGNWESWFNFIKKNFRIQLAGDSRKWGFWLVQYAEKALWKEWTDKFMADFTKILHLMSEDNAQIFTMYESPEVIFPKEIKFTDIKS